MNFPRNEMETDKQTPEGKFLWACQNRTLSKEIAQKLAEEGMDFRREIAAGKYPDGKGFFVLEIKKAARPADILCSRAAELESAAETLEALANLGADCQMAIRELARSAVWAKGARQESEMHKALDVAAQFGADKNGGEDPGDQPLEIAMRGGNPKLFRKLLELGADPAKGAAPIKVLLATALGEDREWERWGMMLQDSLRDGLISIGGKVSEQRRETIGALLIRMVSLKGFASKSVESRGMDLLRAGIEKAAPRELKSLCKELEKKKDWHESFASEALAIAQSRLLERAGAKAARGMGRSAPRGV